MRGRSPRGQRCRGFAPAGHWRTTTFVCALSTRGLHAPLVLDGPINGPAFRAWVEQFLVPELRPSDIVVMDNLSAHKVAGVRAAIERAGAAVKYLPPYSPDFNPIEQVLPSSRRCCERPRPEPSTPFGESLANCSTALAAMSASATFATAAIAGQGETALDCAGGNAPPAKREGY